jgi:uncharacterized MAPEG superfamily protein|tara:strand:+ start:348 stop:755 length:408 start_codon:yes stop_codon:yes gene_type:complete
LEFIEPFKITVLVLGLLALTFLLQLLIVDIVGLKSGHEPGHPIPANHNDALFRVARAISNTNESVRIFILAVIFSIFSSASPEWLSYGTLVYLAGRVGHMVFYYSNLKSLRSIAFGISLIGLAGVLVVGFVPWFY